MKIEDIKVVIGTNSWGSNTYGRLLRGLAVDTSVIGESVQLAKKLDIATFDLAQDYGLGKAQVMMGEFGCSNALISSKYTPLHRFKPGRVRASLERDLREFQREYVDIYWLHLPMDIESNLLEMIALYEEGKIRHIGISNFSLEECQLAYDILARHGIALYGVQNHYSLINRDCEDVLTWCKDHQVVFWAWAVLEEGLLVNASSRSLMKIAFMHKKKKLAPLYERMELVGKAYGLSTAQVAMAYCVNKGVIPICGCRKPYQVQDLAHIQNVQLSQAAMRQLESVAVQCGVHVLGVDIFRIFVR